MVIEERKALGKHLKEMRRKAGLSVLQASEALGMSRNTIEDWERGRKAPTERDMPRLLKLYKGAN